MSPLSHWLFLFGTMILYLAVGLVIFLRYSPDRSSHRGGRR